MAQDRFHVTSAGSVDDGKSTILARLLLDTGSVFEDQLVGINPNSVDATTIADLLDGLDSEREQGITIDVAHRFFDSSSRRYHLADSPGHEQYTRNMATAASNADGMLLVVDARVGIKPQTLTHVAIARMLGIRQYVVAVNKMDLVDYKKKAFFQIKAAVEGLFAHSAVECVVIPVSGIAGDNIVCPSRRMSWWSGETVLGVLDGFTKTRPLSDDTVFSIQYVQRVPGGGRRYLGSVVSGELRLGDSLSSPRYPEKLFGVVELVESGSEPESVASPAEVSVRLDTEVDLERGDTLVTGATVSFTDQCEADLVWLDDNTGFPGRQYVLRIGHATVQSTVTRIFGLSKTGEKLGGLSTMPTNSLVRVNIETRAKLSMANIKQVPEMGRFVLIDGNTGRTVAAGVINHVLRRAENLIEREFEVSNAGRSALTGRQGQVAWFTGLSASGKSSLVDAISVSLTQSGIPHAVLDGDALRLGLSRDLGFSEADRVENSRRTAEVARMMANSGLVVLVSLISPYRADRENARDIVGSERFSEIFMDTPLEICEQRDPKGLYKKARAGLLPNFTGIDAPYEVPEKPDLRITPQWTAADAVQASRNLLNV